MSRFTPSLPEYDAAMHEGISPALRRGPLSYGMPPEEGTADKPTPPEEGTADEPVVV
jgi:hypothetical protein